MLWVFVRKGLADIPNIGNYTHWKSQLAKEGGYQCVYCAIHEGRFGGQRNFHIEHFRPRSRFSHLENDYNNLFYACSICNSYKSNDWPAEPCEELNRAAYIDPSRFDYNGVFGIQGYLVTSTLVSSRYMIERLYLNRPQLIVERRIAECLKKREIMNTEFAKLMMSYEALPQSARSAELCDVFAQLVFEISRAFDLFASLNSMRPYEQFEVSRRAVREVTGKAAYSDA